MWICGYGATQLAVSSACGHTARYAVRNRAERKNPQCPAICAFPVSVAQLHVLLRPPLPAPAPAPLLKHPAAAAADTFFIFCKYPVMQKMLLATSTLTFFAVAPIWFLSFFGLVFRLGLALFFARAF